MRINLDILGTLRICQKDGSMDEVWDKKFPISNNSNHCLIDKYFTDIFFNKIANGSEILATSVLGSGLTDILVGLGTGAQTTYTKDLSAFAPIDIESVVLNWTESAGAKTASTDSTGAISGAGITSSTISQDGTLSIEFSAAPDTGTAITLDFDRGTAQIPSIYFDLATDETPSVATITNFTSLLSLPYVKADIDWLEDVSSNIYSMQMTSTYSGSETDPITGVMLYAKTLNTTTDAMVDRPILKSIYPSITNELFPDGLILNEGNVGQCTITFEIRIKIAK